MVKWVKNGGEKSGFNADGGVFDRVLRGVYTEIYTEFCTSHRFSP